MLLTAKPETACSAGAVKDVTIGALLRSLLLAPAKPLVFTYGGRSMGSGYHVTEVKAGRFEALDCGANPEEWTEIFVQLWDVDGSEEAHMTAGKFAAIVRKVAEHVSLDTSARLTFEVSDGIAPMQLYAASGPIDGGGALRVDLIPRAASCKPRDRWLEGQNRAKTHGCCEGSEPPRCCA